MPGLTCTDEVLGNRRRFYQDRATVFQRNPRENCHRPFLPSCATEPSLKGVLSATL